MAHEMENASMDYFIVLENFTKFPLMSGPYQEFIIIYRGECPTLIYPYRRAYRKVMMQYFRVFPFIINDIINWTKYQFNAYLATIEF